MKNLTFIAFMLLMACTPENTKNGDIYRLEHLTRFVSITSIYSVDTYRLNEIVLIEQQKNKLNTDDSLINNYLYNHSYLATDSFICDSNMRIERFFISFFKKTSCTEYYINHREDKKHEIYGDGTGRNRDCSEDCIAFYSYYRSEDNPNMWYCNYPKDRKDTIWTCRE
ncbi:hypothetical protein [Saccharicrinis aurantiacus]|uniref:hypothetical protein n=1 Tax=Saccharicrinis aurantiacus TaxID=1849719 RepID=UPI00248F8B47|nr:hypothetical protein [Saccharicrinis aurantiacus]